MFVIRDGDTGDRGFVCDSWVDTLQATHEGRAADSPTFRRHHLGIINKVLDRQTTKVLICGPDTDLFTIYGCAVLQPNKIHFVYTRKPWRKLGCAKLLLKGVDIPSCAFSTWSQDVQHWIYEKYTTQDDRGKRIGGLRYAPNWAEVKQDGG